MTREILTKVLLSRSGCSVAAPEGRGTGLPAAIQTFTPDVVIAPASGKEVDDACAAFLAPCSHRKVLRICAVGRNVSIYRFRPERIAINDPSEQELLDAIQEVVLETESGSERS